MLEKDCAVCKEQFQLGTDDPDEQIVVSLPCGEEVSNYALVHLLNGFFLYIRASIPFPLVRRSFNQTHPLKPNKNFKVSFLG